MSIDIREFECLIKNHMDDQPYGIECEECGETLNYTATTASDYDLRLVVAKCDCN